MKTAALFFFAIVLCVHAISDDEVHRQWREFQETYKKSYRSPVEARTRFNIFKKHLEEIEEHNELYDEGKVTWKEGVNKFSDWTDEEIQDYNSRGIIVEAFSGDEDEFQRKWNDFQKTYKKSYRSPVEAEKRFEIFKNNVKKIEEHNELYEQGLVSDKQGINRFSDWTEEEFKNYVNKGLIHANLALSNEDEEFKNKWNDFQKTYKKSYRSPVEAEKRFNIFKNNVKKIEQHNELYEQGLVSDKKGINQFSDWTEEEFRNYISKGLIHENLALSNEDEEIKNKWNDFQKTYKKSYRSPVEAEKRFNIFKNNVKKIEEHNELYEQGLVSDKEGINQFSDWTEEEFKNYISKGLIHKNLALSNEDEEIKNKWNDFQKTYKKSYRSPVEAEKRFEIFKDNVKKIEKYNELYEQGLVSDKEGINQFSDWTEEEFKNYVNKGLLPEKNLADSTDDDMMSRFQEFQEKYGKSYKSNEEAQKRFEIFKENVKKIDEHNKLFDEGKTTFTMGINEFSDWTHEEFLEWLKSH